MVSQAVLYAGHILPFVLLWLGCVTDFIPIKKIGPDCDCFRHILVINFKFFFIQIYALTSVIYGVATFNDCPGAKEELMQEIKEAQDDLRKRKII
ncbi:unnamed protein product [Haemonchus placei]|uniref:Dolichol-phosphate mannosyltransferase subunit 3 n=1 Tax=Haemonchus placei TaxID=6290 RepID=A0A0N4WPH1_HAEPC|nr:unnamed protein product [Haemonchus placei]